MKALHTLTPTLLITTGLLAGALVSCGTTRSQESATPPVAPEGDSDETPASKAAAPPSAEERAVEDDFDAGEMNDSEMSPREGQSEEGAAEPAGAPEAMTSTDPPGLLSALNETNALLDAKLGAETLSCEGALPHRDAICSIAERICELDESAFDDGSRACARAKQSCAQAKRRYRQKCK